MISRTRPAVGNIKMAGSQVVSTETKKEKGPSKSPIHIEPHIILSVCLLTCAVGCDGLTAHDVEDGKVSAASSYRISSLTLVCMLSAPVIRGLNLVDQRAFIGLILVIVSLSGLHECDEETRTGDVTFTTLTLIAIIAIYNSGGIEAGDYRIQEVEQAPHTRQSMSGLCASLLFYVSLRGARAAFVAPSVASNFKVSFSYPDQSVSSEGFAHSSLATTIPLGFGHGVGISIAALLGFHDEARITGSSAVAFQVGCSGVVMCLSAMLALLGQSEHAASMPVLYTAHACRGDSSVCFEAARARRLAMVNDSSASLWLSGLAAIVFSYAVEKRYLTENRVFKETVWQRAGSGFALTFCVVSLVGVFHFVEFGGIGWHTDIITVVCLISIFVCFLGDTLLGSLMYAIAMTFEQVDLVQVYGWKQIFVHLTHLTLFVSLALLYLHIFFTLVKDVALLNYVLKSDSKVNVVLGYVSTMGTSLMFGLYVASALLLAASNGELPQEDDFFRGGCPKRSLIAFLLQHFVPLFLWLSLYGCRCESSLLSPRARSNAWLISLPFDAALYFVILSLLNQDAPTASIMQLGGVSVVGIAGIVSWMLAAYI